MSTTLTEAAPVRGFSREAVEALSRAAGEPDWLREARLAAWETYEATPLPSLRDEQWRRTSIRQLKLDAVTPFAAASGRVARLADAPEAARAGLDTPAAITARAGLVLQQNSNVIYDDLQRDLADKGVLFMGLAEAAREHADLVRRSFMTKAVTPAHDKFSALHGAFWSGGVFLYVPKGVQVELPLQARVYAEADSPAMMPHTLVIVEAGASAVFIDEYISPTGEQQGFADSVVELFTGAGAQLRYVSVQDWGRNVYHFNTQRLVAQRDSSTNSLSILLGGRLTKSNVESGLDGQGATSEMLGIFFGDGAQHFDQHTLQDHLQPNTTSDLLFKGVLRDRARSVFAGLIRVEPHAQRTDAYQANRNLLLSDKARVDTMPKLEIGANDVRCTHGATIGQVDQEQLFYLQSRGLDRPEAERMIVDGFLDEIIQRIPLAEVRDRLDLAIKQKMGLPPSASGEEDDAWLDEA
ncbi:MAG TPA: Fe-S cluster assembly protein SufD [Thermomicrobiales bacterium]|nr:Fe-S cluster assembly protein SufD [Thermomicrobiales bacterium]